MNQQKKNILELAHQFRQMEEKFRLFDLQTRDNLKFWDIFRYDVYMTILSKYGIYENVGIFINPKRFGLLLRIGKLLKYFPRFLVNEFRLLMSSSVCKQYCFLFISRFKDEHGNPQDFLLSDIYQHLKQKAFVLELSNNKSFNRKNTGKRYFLFKREYYYLFFAKKNREDWTELTSIINEHFQISVDWTPYFDAALSTFKADHKFFWNLFKRLKPKFLFFQSQPKGMIKAARDLGIITLDIQHGSENKTVVLYSYPPHLTIKDVPTIPHYFLTLGKVWNERVELPSKKRMLGNTYFFVEKHIDVRSRHNVLVITNVFVHSYLKEATRLLAQHNPGILFYYKLHSNQVDQVEETKRYFKDIKNVEVIYTEKNVKDILDDCFALVLIQSSVAYQALQAGLQVYIFKEDFYEASFDIFNEPNVHLVRDWAELNQMLKRKIFSNDEPTLFFERFCPDAFRKLLKEIEYDFLEENKDQFH